MGVYHECMHAYNYFANIILLYQSENLKFGSYINVPILFLDNNYIETNNWQTS